MMCDFQTETTALLSTALNPTGVDLSRLASVSLLLDEHEVRATLRSFRHNHKKHQELSCKAFAFDRLDEMGSAVRNYAALLNAVFLLKPPIYKALLAAAEAAVDFARYSPRNGKIMRLIAAHFFEGVEDVLRAAGSGLTADQVAARIDAIDFNDPRAAHTSSITVYHMMKFNHDGTRKTTVAGDVASNSNNPAPANNNGAAGGGGGAGGEKPLSKSAIKRARDKERKALWQKKTTKDDNPLPTTGGKTDKCPWWNSTRGCDAARRKGAPCDAHRHTLPTKEEDRLALVAYMSKAGLTAKEGFPDLVSALMVSCRRGDGSGRRKTPRGARRC